MDKLGKIITLHRLLGDRKYPVPLGVILDELECSRPTFHRIREFFINVLGAPLEYDRKYKGYHYRHDQGKAFELPGLWFTTGELEALFCMEYMLETMQSQVLDHILAPARKRLNALLEEQGISRRNWRGRIKYLPLAFRSLNDQILKTIAEAVLKSRQVSISYRAANAAATSSRIISPQTLLRYRDNWYVDAWCHTRNELRTFCIDRIENAQLLKIPAKRLASKELETFFAGSYGIFSGKADQIAEIAFSGAAARIVSREKWHPLQEGFMQADGTYILKIPYKEDLELIMDIMRWGPLAEVINPPQLRQKIADKLRDALRKYQKYFP